MLFNTDDFIKTATDILYSGYTINKECTIFNKILEPTFINFSTDKINDVAKRIAKINQYLNWLTFDCRDNLINTFCEIDNCNIASNTTKIYSGSYGYNVAYRIVDNKLYSGTYGYEVVYRIDGNKVYSGSYGYDIAYRIDGNKIYSGSYGYEVAFRVDGNKVYSGSYGYNVAYRIGE